jgi:hypothetical protein
LHNLGLASSMTDALRAVVGPKDHPNRTIRDAGHAQRLDGPVLRHEGGRAAGDQAADEAYEGLGATWELYARVYDRNSIDDHGLPLEGVVHFERDYDNAFWDGHRMVFGDGDGTLFNRFTIAVDVIGHELTHGVTGAALGLKYLGQAGALNESISDVFGALVKQYRHHETAEKADWLIGAGLLRPSVHGVALRSMKAPGTAYDDPVLGKDPQPAHMDDFVHTTADNGGVHLRQRRGAHQLGDPQPGLLPGGRRPRRPRLGAGRADLVRHPARPDAAPRQPLRRLRPVHRPQRRPPLRRKRRGGGGGGGRLGTGRRQGLRTDGVAGPAPDAPITFERHGGFGGVVLRATFTPSELSGPEADAIAAVRREARSRPPEPRPDRFEYHLDLPDGRVVIHDEDLPEPLRPLVTRLVERARQRP